MTKKGTNIEAEGGELVLQNSNGDTVIIPKVDRDKLQKMLDSNDHSGVDEYVSGLPSMEDYARDGTLIPNIEAADGLKLSKKEQTAAYASAQQQNAAASMETLGNITQPETPLNVPEVKNNLASLEEIHPSLKEFGDELVNIPEGYQIKAKDFEKQLTDWKTAGKAIIDSGVDAEGNELRVPDNIPYPYQQGCLGSACRVQIGDQKSYYDIRRDAGIITSQTGDEEILGSGYESIDSWEFAGAVEASGIGKNWMKPERGLEGYSEKRKKGESSQEYLWRTQDEFKAGMKPRRKAMGENFGDVPIGSLLTTGSSDEGGYTEKGSKTILNIKGEKQDITQKVKPRHSIRYRGIDPETGDYLFYNYGALERVKADKSDFDEFDESNYSDKYGQKVFGSMEDYLNKRDVMYVTSLTEQGDWSKNKIEKVQKHNRMIESQNKEK